MKKLQQFKDVNWLGFNSLVSTFEFFRLVDQNGPSTHSTIETEIPIVVSLCPSIFRENILWSCVALKSDAKITWYIL